MKYIIKQLYYFLLALRPKSWMKNLILFLPLIFSGNLLNIHAVYTTSLIFIIFCLFVWGTYIINDYKDREYDKKHPTKKNRPLASGKLSATWALFSAIGLILLSLVVSYYLGWYITLGMFLCYWINTTIYTLYLKQTEIIDIFSIAIGFVIRWIIWVVIISASFSPWFFMILFFGALWLGFVKRYQEVQVWTNTRIVIKKYNSHFLEQIISIMTSTLLMSYALYTFNSVQSQNFLLTLPIIAFLIIRMYYNIFFLKRHEESLEQIILSDKRIIISSLLYILICIGIIVL